MLRLRWQTPPGWFEVVQSDFVAFLQDHAANERKVSQSALVLASHHPNRIELVDLALAIADEELQHFRQVWEILKARGATLAADAPDPYMKRMFGLMRKHDAQLYLLDRLLLYAVVEARGCERFGLVADGLGDQEPMGAFYRELERSEARHHAHYLRMARAYFPAEVVNERLDEILDAEAEIARTTPFSPALH
ncbi:MAG: tRNA-(ms[2]io[6]A)-hydroxylase [Deltaproteobacteria bacterium]|nr:tRNA-(ms[2]io[6]A)-hydroxylase [Deltaproteobacteria bacterium]